MDHWNSSDNSSAHRPPLFGVLQQPAASKRSVLRDTDQLSTWQIGMVNDLAALVGGIDALEHLDSVPLPDEPFDWGVVTENDRSFVENLLGLIDDHVERLFGIEYRTVTHRLIERIASLDSATLRSGSQVRTAAAITWLALHGNGVVNGRPWPTANGIWAMFRVSSCAARGRSLFKSAGLAPRHAAPHSMFGKMSESG
jgi:hypothetical protein